MKYTTPLLAVLSLSSTTSATPTSWTFEIASLTGPGCPDSGNSTDYGTTRLTLRSNTVDMNTPEDWYQFIAYPWLRVDLAAGQDHTWCQVTLNYKEFKDTANMIEGSDWRMNLHKNGTKGLATWDVGKGVKIYWDFAYQVDKRSEVTDSIAITGPAQSGKWSQPLYSNTSDTPQLIPLSKCGRGSFSFTTELFVSGDTGKKGIVASEFVTSEDSSTKYYGTQQGFSYGFEKCS